MPRSKNPSPSAKPGWRRRPELTRPYGRKCSPFWRPTAGMPSWSAVARSATEGEQRFGPYRTERLLGRGGMGSVYLARRDDGQFEQTVALKVTAPHLSGEEFARSFRNERQLLAALSHPHIARLLDGGVTAAGDPYLMMEYVEGELWDGYCADRRLSVKARIGLFLQVCEAVEYAHQNLIIHGDLKPANILVTAEGSVKLLDFGTAKILRDPAGSVTRFAAFTPRYASPEQLRGERVNTLTDVFSLGVILYELLTGAWPFGDPDDRTANRGKAIAPAGAVSARAAAEHGLTYDRLRRQIEGDLSVILLKMLETDPADRYASVRLVREDLERFCEGRPVHARPHTAWYTARRFAARHWLAVLATGVSVAALAGLTVFSVYQSAQARAQAARAQRIADFAKNTFLSAGSIWNSPLRAKHEAIQFTDILDNACTRVGSELGGDPEAEADLRSTLGLTYALLGEPAKGEAQLLLGIQLLPRIRGGAPKIAANLYSYLCDTQSFEGRYADALIACRQSVALHRAAATGVLGSALHDTAFMAVSAGEPLPDAEAMYREGLQLPRPNLPEQSAIINSRLGMLRLREGDLEGGERLLREAEPTLRGKTEPLIEIVPVLYARGFLEDVRGNYPAAAKLMAEALDLVTRKQAGFMSPDDLALQLAAYQALAGKASALAPLRELEARLLSAEGGTVDRIHRDLFAGIVEDRYGSKTEAEKRMRSGLKTAQEQMNRQPDLSVEIYVRLLELLHAAGRHSEAAQTARAGLAAAAQAYGNYFARHPFVIEMLSRP